MILIGGYCNITHVEAGGSSKQGQYCYHDLNERSSNYDESICGRFMTKASVVDRGESNCIFAFYGKRRLLWEN